MRIAMIGHKRITAFEGGIEKTVLQLSAHMTAAGHRVTVFDRNCGQKEAKPGFSATKKQLSGIHVVKVPTFKGPAEVPFYSFLASVLAAFGKYDVVMYHASGPCFSLPIVKLAGKKTIAFIHGIDSQRSKWGLFAKAYLRLGEKTAAKYADELLLLSESNRAHFINKYGREGRIVFNGVEKPASPPDKERILKKYGLSSGQYILFSGRVSKEKGLHYLIPAFLLSRSGDKKLVIAGKVDMKHPEYYHRLLAMNKGKKNIIYTGNLPQGELTVLYQNASIFTLPSEIEGMPHSLLEALACGAPCLLSDIYENKAVAGKHAVYFRSGDRKDLQEKLQYMMDHPEKLGDITEGEEEEVLRRYDLDKSAEQIMKICERLAASGRS